MGRDKFAALAKATERQPTPPAAAENAPKRDKLAALAASRSTPTDSPPQVPGGGNSKLAAMAAASSRSTERVVTETLGEKDEKRKSELQEKMSKRKQILQDLDRAEDLTCKLLDIVHQTTNSLQDMTSSSSELAQLSREYRKTLQEIHPLLSRGTEALVQPYQNHATETKQSMYAARVEMRLAKERTDVLRAFTELERQQNQSTASEERTAGTKRSREEDGSSIIQN